MRHSIVQFSSVAQSCLTLGDCMGCSMPGLPAQTENHSTVGFSRKCIAFFSIYLLDDYYSNERNLESPHLPSHLLGLRI